MSSPLYMEEPLHSHFQSENESLRRMLDFITEENLNLKQRLSEVIKNLVKNDLGILEEIEYFNNQFAEEDESIKSMERKISDHEKLLIREIYGHGIGISEIKRKQDILRNEMKNTEKHFNTLKYAFNFYVTGII
jgi:hypothetical protein